MARRVVLSLVLANALLFGENLVKNGSFEAFNKDEVYKWSYVEFDEWEGDGEVWSNRFGKIARDGFYKAELDVRGGTVDSLSQTIQTEEGKEYLFSIDAYARKDGTSDFEVLLDGEVILKVSPTTTGWNKYGVNFKGKGGEQVLTIREVADQDDGSGALIDNVVVQSDIVDLSVLKDQELAKSEIFDPWGLDQILDILDYDRTLAFKASAEEIQKAKDAAKRMNELIREAIKNEGLANDGVFTAADAMEINIYLTQNYSGEWKSLREDYAVIEKSGETRALGHSALDHVWGYIYNLGNPKYSDSRTAKVTGEKSKSFEYVSYLLNWVVDKEGVKNPDYQEVKGTTGTSMDKIVEVILKDRGLNEENPMSTLREGARYANEMNKLIIEGIKATGIANDGHFTPADIRTLNRYLVENYKQEWAELHGDDEDNEETGYHVIQNDGATTRMYGHNVINTIADGIYHLGYPTDHKYHLVNEDGNRNQSFEDVAWWLEISLANDIKAGKLSNPDVKEVQGTTGTALDKIIDVIYTDEGLLRKVSLDDIREAARCANRMNELIVEAIKELGVAQDNYISTDEVKEINAYLVENYQAEWAQLHGDDEDDEETGFHRIQNDGAVQDIEGRNLINTVADGIYHLGYPTDHKYHLVNEDGNRNVRFYSVGYWLTKYLKEDMDKLK